MTNYEKHREVINTLSEIPINTPILVRDYDTDDWIEGCFAGINDKGNVTAWHNGIVEYRISWYQAKLVE